MNEQITFTWTKENLSIANRYFFRFWLRSKRRWWFLIMGVVFIALLSTTIWTWTTGGFSINNCGPLIVFFLMLITFPFLFRWEIKKTLKKAGEITFRLEEKGLWRQDKLLSGYIHWYKIRCTFDHPDCILFELGEETEEAFFIVPKSAFPDQDISRHFYQTAYRIWRQYHQKNTYEPVDDTDMTKKIIYRLTSQDVKIFDRFDLIHGSRSPLFLALILTLIGIPLFFLIMSFLKKEDFFQHISFISFGLLIVFLVMVIKLYLDRKNLIKSVKYNFDRLVYLHPEGIGYQDELSQGVIHWSTMSKIKLYRGCLFILPKSESDPPLLFVPGRIFGDKERFKQFYDEVLHRWQQNKKS